MRKATVGNVVLRIGIAANTGARCPLPHRDRKPARVGVRDQPDLPARRNTKTVKATEVWRMPKRSWRRMQSSIATGELQDPAFKIALTMTLLIWTLGGLAIALAIFARS